jgi:ABC-type phosphate transport system permease subunit
MASETRAAAELASVRKLLIWLAIGYALLVVLPIVGNVSQEYSSLSRGQTLTATVVRTADGTKRMGANALVQYAFGGALRERELQSPPEDLQVGQSIHIVVDSRGDAPRSPSAGYLARGAYLLLGVTLVYLVIARLLVYRFRRRRTENSV